MSEQLLLDAEKILKKKFKGKNGGYDALEVDEFLDMVHKDYLAIAQLQQELKVAKEKAESQSGKNVDLEAQKIQLTRKIVDLEKLIVKGGNSIDNLRKIDKYERKLWELGVDPSKVK